MCKRSWIIAVALLMVTLVVIIGACATKNTAPKSKQQPHAKTTKAKSTPKQPALPRLVDVGAQKCIPCKMMIPVLDQLKKEYKGKLLVEFVDVWKYPSAKTKYRIKMIPTQILYDAKGKEISRHEGYFPKEDVLGEFKKHGIKLTR
jgi:thioredoxin 1